MKYKTRTKKIKRETTDIKEGVIEDNFLKEYKALVCCALIGKYSFRDYIEGGEDLFSKNTISEKIYSFITPNDIQENLYIFDFRKKDLYQFLKNSTYIKNTEEFEIFADRIKRITKERDRIIQEKVDKGDSFEGAVKGSGAGVLVGSQGYLTIFPVKVSEKIDISDGFVMCNSIQGKARIPQVD